MKAQFAAVARTKQLHLIHTDKKKNEMLWVEGVGPPATQVPSVEHIRKGVYFVQVKVLSNIAFRHRKDFVQFLGNSGTTYGPSFHVSIFSFAVDFGSAASILLSIENTASNLSFCRFSKLSNLTWILPAMLRSSSAFGAVRTANHKRPSRHVLSQRNFAQGREEKPT